MAEMAFACPHCGDHRSDVTDSRNAVTVDGARRRRRKCIACGTHYGTLEVLEARFRALQRTKFNDGTSTIHRVIALLQPLLDTGEEGPSAP